jgi:hypothetical protein
MTRHDTLQCVHEPFGDAYYFGPERLAERYENDPQARKESGYGESTYRTIFDRIARENSEVRLLMFLLHANILFYSIQERPLHPSLFSRHFVSRASVLHPPIPSYPTPPTASLRLFVATLRKIFALQFARDGFTHTIIET